MKKLLIIVLSLLFLVLTWSPWLNEEDAKGIVAKNTNFIEQHQKLDFKPEVNVIWVPFGRWVTTIEGGWFVTFWGSVI